jgi:hypothetical protein
MERLHTGGGEYAEKAQLIRNNKTIFDIWGVIRAEVALEVELVTPEVRDALEAWHEENFHDIIDCGFAERGFGDVSRVTALQKSEAIVTDLKQRLGVLQPPDANQ